MLAIASSLAGHDVLRVLIPMIPYAFWYATPENDWADLFHRYIPDWMAVKNRIFLTEYYRGEATFYQWEIVQGWLMTTVVWGGFLCAMVFLMVCINTLVRKQWTEHEKLSYPIIQLPLELTNVGSQTNLLTNKMMWLGFGLPAQLIYSMGSTISTPLFRVSVVDSMICVPFLHRNRGVRSAGHRWLSFLSRWVWLFFIPLDLSFSCWFFYIFWKVERIFGDALGVRGMPNFPFTDEQSFGAYLGLFVIAIIATRKHLAQVGRKLFTNDRNIDDSDEPMSYRVTVLGIIVSLVFIIGFGKIAGMSIWVVLVFFGIYYAISTAVTRMRAELGSPVPRFTLHRTRRNDASHIWDAATRSAQPDDNGVPLLFQPSLPRTPDAAYLRGV